MQCYWHCNSTANGNLQRLHIETGPHEWTPEDAAFATSPKTLIEFEIFYILCVIFASRIPSMHPMPLLLDDHSTSHLS